MKSLVALVLSLLVAFGSVIPCCLWDNCSDEQIAMKLNNASDEEDDDANCSPFAACSSCNGFIPITKSIRLIPAPSIQYIYNDPPVSDYLSVHLPSFWQPPRQA